MASRGGPMVQGSDGSDFLHRETVATHYQISALNKGRLRKCVFAHLLLALVMGVKLVPDLLDRMDIFIMEVEELEVPAPLKWEYAWLAGATASLIGLSAIRKNTVLLLQIYFGLVNLLSTVPILLAIMIYFGDFFEFVTEDEPGDLEMWQGYPVAALWYGFCLIAMQVHIFTLIFAWKLIVAWKGRGASKKAQ